MDSLVSFGIALIDSSTHNFIMSEKIHPCMSCGACCAYFRISFLHIERENFDIYKVPLSLTVTSDSKIYTLLGTEKKHRPKCASLKGRIGELATCQIYENRPSPCRNFMPSFANGKKNLRCDEARKGHGLAPLTRLDWELFFGEDLLKRPKEI